MLETTIAVRETEITPGFSVRRALPFRAKRSVGPFVFLDHMGPLKIGPAPAGEVGQHPHIGLSTVTYLFEGELSHRDSLGSFQAIVPGDVNWMTAGKGIAHAERILPEVRARGMTLHGLQAWVALPAEDEDCEPTFQHVAKEELPSFDVDGVSHRLIAGRAFGRETPVRTHSDLFYVASEIPAGCKLRFDPEGREAAFYLISGVAVVGGQSFQGPLLLAFKKGEPVEISAADGSEAFGMLLGGEPLESPRHMFWNFVSSSQEKIEDAKRRWEAREFPKVPGETSFIPLPPKHR